MSAEAYRRKAGDYFAIALQVTDPVDRSSMLAIAAHWMAKAEEAEQHERIVQPKETEAESSK